MDQTREQARAARQATEPALKKTYQQARRDGNYARAAVACFDYTTLCRAEYPNSNGTTLAALTIQSWEDEMEAEQAEAAMPGAKVERCPGCGCARSTMEYQDRLSHVLRCARCDGLFGVVTPEVRRRYARDEWTRNKEPQTQYVDFQVLQHGGETRRIHGHVDRANRRWSQLG